MTHSVWTRPIAYGQPEVCYPPQYAANAWTVPPFVLTSLFGPPYNPTPRRDALDTLAADCAGLVSGDRYE